MTHTYRLAGTKEISTNYWIVSQHIGMFKCLKSILTSNNEHQEEGTSNNNEVSHKQCLRRERLLLPFSIIANILFLVVAILDFKDDIIGQTNYEDDGVDGVLPMIKFTSIEEPAETPLLFSAFASFGLVLILDLIFIIVAISQGGRRKFSQLSGALLHHCGFLVWVTQLLLGYIPYTTGVGYCLFLLEFCYPVRMIQSIKFDGKSRSEEESRLKTKAMVFCLDMFFSGGGTFAATFVYIATLSCASANIYWKIFWTYLLAIIYWFFQLFFFHRRSLERILQLHLNLELHKSIQAYINSHENLTETFSEEE